MKKILAAAAVVCLVIGLAYGPAFSARTGKVDPDVEGVAIYVAPQTLVLDSPVPCVTVHADIPLADLDLDLGNPVDLVRLNEDLVPYAVFADSRGLLVAKFDIADVAAIVAPGSATLTLKVLTVDGEVSGSDTIVVK